MDESMRRKLTDKEQEFNSGMQKLNNQSIPMVDDFQRPAVKDVAVEHIDTVTKQPLVGLNDVNAKVEAFRQARQQALGKMAAPQVPGINYNDMRNEFAQKAMGFAKNAGKKAIAAVPFAGAAYAALQGDHAMAADELAGSVPVAGQIYDAIKPEPSGPAAGSLDDRMERGTLTDEDKKQLRIDALSKLR